MLGHQGQGHTGLAEKWKILMINRMVGNTGIFQVQDAGTVKSKLSC